jgi:hypothetical protein
MKQIGETPEIDHKKVLLRLLEIREEQKAYGELIIKIEYGKITYIRESQGSTLPELIRKLW